MGIVNSHYHPNSLFAGWSAIGNNAGAGNIHLTDSTGAALQPLVPNSEIGYLRDAAWSRDGKQLIMWSSQNNSVVYLVNADGTGLVKKQLDMQIFSTPQFTPDNESIIFYVQTHRLMACSK